MDGMTPGADFLARQMDYAFFINSLAGFFLAAVGMGLRRWCDGRREWFWLIAAGIVQGSVEFAGLLIPVFSEIVRPLALEGSLFVLPFFLLAEFGRRALLRQGRRLPRRSAWILPALVVVVLTVAGITGVPQNVGLGMIGLVGGLVAAGAFFGEAREWEKARIRLEMAAAGMVLYSLAALVCAVGVSGLPGQVLVKLFAGMVMMLTAGCIWSAFVYEDWQSSFTTWGQITPGQRDVGWTFLLLLIIGWGWLITDYIGRETEDGLRDNIKKITQAAAAALPEEDLFLLTSGGAGEDHPAYRRLQHQMFEIKEAYPGLLWTYVMVRREGQIFFLVDSTQTGDGNYSSFNLRYERPPAELDNVFRTGLALTAGPYTDEWGRFVSGFAPIRDHFSGQLAGVFAVDIDVKDWARGIAKHRLAPISVTFLLWLLAVGAFLARQRLLVSAQRIAASEERLTLAMQGANDGLWDWNILTGEVYFSPQWQRMLGFEDGELAYRLQVWEALLHPDDRDRALAAIYGCRDGTQGKLEMEIRLRHKMGHYVDILSRAFAVRRDADGRAVRLVGTHVDISERNRINRELLVAKETAESATRTKSAFLANMSHEIRTPMNAILGFAQLMLRDSQVSAAQRQSLDTINRSGEHLLALINDILEMSKVEAGRMVLCPEEFDLAQFAQDLELMFQLRAKEKGLDFRLSAEGFPPGGVVADKQKLRQICYNLVSNAVKFTSAGSVTVRLRVQGQETEKLRLIGEVADTGPGISEEDQQKLFMAFSQTETGMKAGGTGLGLAISREFARLMGGDIGVSSRKGEGSCFRLEIPLQPGQVSAGRLPEETLRVESVAGTAEYRILVADDTPENAQLLTTLLNGVGFLTRSVTDGQQAVEACREWQPHMVFMDIRMPVMDGFAATQAIRQMTGGTGLPVIGISASVLQEEKQRALDSGINRYIRKPFREEEIFAAIAAFLPVEYIRKQSVAEVALAQPVAEEEEIPLKLAAELKDAVQKARFDRLLELLDELALERPVLAGQLRELAQRYDYDKLLELLTRE